MSLGLHQRARRRIRLAHRSLTDWLLGALGFSMATASASFAGYMIITAPAEVTGFGSKDFNIFVQWDRRAPGGPGHAPPERPTSAPPPALVAQATLPPSPPRSPSSADVDLTPTGSIPSAEAVGARASRATAGAGTGGPLRDFRVRDVFGGRALIEHRSRLTLVEPGSILAGAGKVLAIERQGGLWVVRTASGVIGGT